MLYNWEVVWPRCRWYLSPSPCSPLLVARNLHAIWHNVIFSRLLLPLCLPRCQPILPSAFSRDPPPPSLYIPSCPAILFLWMVAIPLFRSSSCLSLASLPALCSLALRISHCAYVVANVDRCGHEVAKQHKARETGELVHI